MKRILLVLAVAAMPVISWAQQEDEAKDTSWKKNYRESYAKTNDLVHTKLEVAFDFDKSYLYGKEWLTLKPHFYATDSVLLDAKGMDIKKVSLVKGTTSIPLKYNYDGMQLNVKLSSSYTRNDSYTLYIEYVSKPNELVVKGSAAITDAKGLYFINPKGEDKGKPTQVWTQGETESNSVWFVTIDKSNQRSTEEIYMTVPAKFVTLSNGLLKSQKLNADGTRTDYWKMDLPHAPYLFFMGVGDFAVIKDTPYEGKEVSYYVEKEYAPYAKGIFGLTPEMIKFFSTKLGVEFPWPKYAQIVGRDYVSGAMENTTATLHQESAYQNNRQLADGNVWEETIAHELFHQWFGDLVTAESWSNLTVNESFANYSEYLWDEYKRGKDFADAHHFEDMQGYLMSGSEKKDLVRFYYADKEDMFDAVSYNKGGRILNMLRNYVGDDAFFKSLNHYLTTNKFKSGEASQLRLSFEEITGKDLNWFWNQWYYGSGHPKLKISYKYDVPGIATVYVEQTQKSDKLFKLPIAIDIYTGSKIDRKNVWLQNKIDSFSFAYSTKPSLINVDADKILLAEKTDNKSEENYVAQWNYAKTYQDRREALDYFAKKVMPVLSKGLKDPFAGLRQYTLQKIVATPLKKDSLVLVEIEKMAKSDPDNKTKAAAINYLIKNGNGNYLSVYQAAINDSSYSVAGAALKGLVSLDATKGYQLAKKYSKDAKDALGNVVSDILIAEGTESDFDFIADAYKNAPPSQEKIKMTDKFGAYLLKVKDISLVKKGIDNMISFRNMIPEQYHAFIDPSFKTVFDNLTKAKGSEIETYIKSVFK